MTVFDLAQKSEHIAKIEINFKYPNDISVNMIESVEDVKNDGPLIRGQSVKKAIKLLQRERLVWKQAMYTQLQKRIKEEKDD